MAQMIRKRDGYAVADKTDNTNKMDLQVTECFRTGAGKVTWLVRCHVVFEQGLQIRLAVSAGPVPVQTAHATLRRQHAFFNQGRLWVEQEYSIELPRKLLAFKITGTGRDDKDYIYKAVTKLDIARCRELIAAHDERICNAFEDATYPQWLASRRATPEQLLEQAGAVFDSIPLVSIVTPVYKTPPAFLRAVIESVHAQSYANWEYVLVNASPDDEGVGEVLSQYEDPRIKVILQPLNDGIVGNTNAGIAAATGDYIAFLDHDDLLEPDALYEYVRYLEGHPGTEVLYCDEDSIDEQGTLCNPLFKPDFNVDLLYSNAYFLHFLMVSRIVIEQTERAGKDVEGAQDFDLFLKAADCTDAIGRAAGAGQLCPIGHVSRVLYHWRIHAGSLNTGNSGSKPYAQQSGANALTRHFARRGLAANVELEDDPFTYRVTYKLPEPRPLVSVVACAWDAEACAAAMDTLARYGDYPNLELLVVCTEQFSHTVDDERLRIITWDAPFDELRMRNFAASQATGEYLLFAYAGVAPMEGSALNTALGYLQRPEVGLVAPRLLYADGLVEHMGLVLHGDGGYAAMGENLPADDIGYIGRCQKPCNWSAAGAACQLLRTADLIALDGYDEMYETPEYASIDLCLRLRQGGKLVAYTPYASFKRIEPSSTLGAALPLDDPAAFDRDKVALHKRWSALLAKGDSYYNTNLDITSSYFKLAD